MLNIIDEFTRECLTIDVARSITADDVVNRLDALAAECGAPCYLRMDNGPEFVAHAINDWCRFNASGSHALHRSRLTLAERLDRVV
jgi:putative transposase